MDGSDGIERSQFNGTDADEKQAEIVVFSRRECSICLSSFRADDYVCMSNNPECRHVFHRACIHPWLMEHEDCPCCRQLYFHQEEDGRDDDEENAL